MVPHIRIGDIYNMDLMNIYNLNLKQVLMLLWGWNTIHYNICTFDWLHQ